MDKKIKKSFLVVLLVLVAPGLLISFLWAYVLRSFTALPDSMEPTIYAGDRMLVDLTAYKMAVPKRGDVVVYRYPKNPAKCYFHRIVAFPGESVELKDHRIRINGVELKEAWAIKVRHYNGGKLAKKGMKPVIVDPDSYYVLGDNAARSEDSRAWGFLPKKNVIGKAFKIYYPFDRLGPVE